jgi:hypothetical protein
MTTSNRDWAKLHRPGHGPVNVLTARDAATAEWDIDSSSLVLRDEGGAAIIVLTDVAPECVRAVQAVLAERSTEPTILDGSPISAITTGWHDGLASIATTDADGQRLYAITDIRIGGLVLLREAAIRLIHQYDEWAAQREVT